MQKIRSVSLAVSLVFFLGLEPKASGQGTQGVSGAEVAIPVTGRPQPKLAVLDELMLGYMRRLQIPGAALAVTYKGRLVYDRGFGFADLEKKKPVEPKSLFRIASVSKPFTAVAILQLVEQGKLKLDDKVYDLLRPKPFGDRKLDEHWKQITILQLLQHRGGWDRDKSFDPMFRSHLVAAAAGHQKPAEPVDIIRYMAGRPLDSDPGESYSYSNFGYCLLGRVIERVTGKTYEEYVQESVLRKVGIRRMHVGATLLEKKHPDEVRYYGGEQRLARSVFSQDEAATVPRPYGGFYLEAMDSHGGWIACVSDLLRFARDFDDPKKSVLLSEASIRTMFARPPGSVGLGPRSRYYGCGWLVRVGESQDHGGSLPGTTTKLMRRSDGICWALLLNTREDGRGTRLRAGRFEGTLQRTLSSIREW